MSNAAPYRKLHLANELLLGGTVVVEPVDCDDELLVLLLLLLEVAVELVVAEAEDVDAVTC